MTFKAHSSATTTPKIILNKGVKSFKNKEAQWIIFGFDVKISQCEVNRRRLILKQDSKILHQLVANPKIVIHNSSFRSLDLKSGTEALISDCILNAKINHSQL